MTGLHERRDAPHELGIGIGESGAAVAPSGMASWKGRPTRSVMRVPMAGQDGAAPRSRSVPEMPTGSTGAPVRVASSETPGLGVPMTPSKLRVPSGRMATTPPRSRTALATRYASMSLPPALTGWAPSERMKTPAALEERLLGQEGRAPLQGRTQPAADEGRIGVADVVGSDDERAARGQVVETLHADTADGLQAESSEAGDEAWVGARPSGSLMAFVFSRARMTPTTSATVSSNAGPRSGR